MSDTIYHSQPAFILHQKHFRESSLIFDVLTRDFGRMSVLAKGVRKTNSKSAGLLRPFVALSLSFVGKSDLKTLTNVEMTSPINELAGLALYCGFYISELVSIFLHKDDPHPEVFLDYQTCLQALSQGSQLQASLRIFELNLMNNIGYGVNLDYDFRNEKPVALNKKYSFNKDEGLYADDNGAFLGLSLMAIQQRDFEIPQTLTDAKLLMRTVIDAHLEGKQLKSRKVINSIIKRLY